MQNFQPINIRQAEAADVEKVERFAVFTYRAAFGAGFSPSDLAAHIERQLSRTRIAEYLRDDVVLVAELSGDILGFAQFGATDEPHDRELRRLYVHPQFQNLGIGTQLMEAALSYPEMRSAGVIFLDVWEANEGARRLYERFGFVVVGRRPFRVASGMITGFDLIMERRLAAPEP